MSLSSAMQDYTSIRQSELNRLNGELDFLRRVVRCLIIRAGGEVTVTCGAMEMLRERKLTIEQHHDRPNGYTLRVITPNYPPP